MVDLKRVTTTMLSMNRQERRDYFKKNRRDLLEIGITWEMIASQFTGKGVIKNLTK